MYYLIWYLQLKYTENHGVLTFQVFFFKSINVEPLRLPNGFITYSCIYIIHRYVLDIALSSREKRTEINKRILV